MTRSGQDRTLRKGCIQCSREFTADLRVCPHDGTLLTSLGQDNLVGTVLADRYEILEVIGGGAMGLVYKARHRLMDRIVAIKTLHKHLVSSAGVLRRFQIEAQAAASCLSFPNILTIYDFGLSEDGQPFMVMDYLDGSSLGDILEKEGFISVPRAVGIFIQVCTGLAHAHSKGIIHRDMKPSNIMLINFDGEPDFVKIVDFGIAKLLRQTDQSAEQLTKTGELFGSPLYMSPEQCKGKTLDARSDIYSLGSIMYRALTGWPIFQGEEVVEFLFKQVSEMPQPFKAIAPNLIIPKSLEAIVFKALAKDPETRWQTMDDLKHALEDTKIEIGGVVLRPTSLPNAVPSSALLSYPATAMPSGRKQSQSLSNMSKIPQTNQPLINQIVSETLHRGGQQPQPGASPSGFVIPPVAEAKQTSSPGPAIHSVNSTENPARSTPETVLANLDDTTEGGINKRGFITGIVMCCIIVLAGAAGMFFFRSLEILNNKQPSPDKHTSEHKGLSIPFGDGQTTKPLKSSLVNSVEKPPTDGTVPSAATSPVESASTHPIAITHVTTPPSGNAVDTTSATRRASASSPPKPVGPTTGKANTFAGIKSTTIDTVHSSPSNKSESTTSAAESSQTKSHAKPGSKTVLTTPKKQHQTSTSSARQHKATPAKVKLLPPIAAPTPTSSTPAHRHAYSISGY